MAQTDCSKYTSSSSYECSDYNGDHEFEPYQFEPTSNSSNSGLSEEENDPEPEQRKLDFKAQIGMFWILSSPDFDK